MSIEISDFIREEDIQGLLRKVSSLFSGKTSVALEEVAKPTSSLDDVLAKAKSENAAARGDGDVPVPQETTIEPASYQASPDTPPALSEDVRAESLRADIAQDLGIARTDSIQVEFDTSGEAIITVVDGDGKTIAKIVPVDSLDNGTERWFLNNVDADRKYIISTLEGDTKPFTTARELMKLGVIQKDDVIYFNDHLTDDDKGFCYRNNQLLVVNYDGTWTCSGPDCPPEAPAPLPEPVAEAIQEPVEPEPAPEPEPEPVIVEAAPEPESLPTEQFSDARQKLFLAVCGDGTRVCDSDVLLPNILRETHILSIEDGELDLKDEAVREKIAETRAILNQDPDYQRGVKNPFFIIEMPDGSLKCVELRTGDVSNYDPNEFDREGGKAKRIGAGEGDAYLRGTFDKNGSYEGDTYVPGEPLKVIGIDTNGDGKIDRYIGERSLEETIESNRTVVGEAVFDESGGLEQNQSRWEGVLRREIPERFWAVPDAKKPQVLMDAFGLSRREANDLAVFLDTYTGGPTVVDIKKELGISEDEAATLIHKIRWYQLSAYGVEEMETKDVKRLFPGLTNDQAERLRYFMFEDPRFNHGNDELRSLGYTTPRNPDGTTKTVGQVLDESAREAKRRGDIY